LFRTFWGLFGWAHVPLLGGRPYRLILVATLAGVAGSLPVLWQKRRSIPWDLLVLFGLTLAAIWGLTFVRGASYLGHPNLYIPVARYAFPAIIPTVMLLSVGWLSIWKEVSFRLRLPRWGMWVLYLIPLVGLDLLALSSIFRYYNG
jgi:hypothetical protein